MIKTLPDANEPITADGILNDQTRLYLEQLGLFLQGQEKRVIERFADLAALQAAIPNPAKDQEGGIVTGQGLAIFDGTDWVLAADDTTLVI